MSLADELTEEAAPPSLADDLANEAPQPIGDQLAREALVQQKQKLAALPETGKWRELFPAMFDLSDEQKQNAETTHGAFQKLRESGLTPTQIAQNAQAVHDKWDAIISMASESRPDNVPKFIAQRDAELRQAGVEPMNLDSAFTLPKMDEKDVRELFPHAPGRAVNAIQAGQNTAAALGEGFASPEGVLMFPAGVGPQVGRAFLAQMAASLPVDLSQAAGHYSAGDPESGDSKLIQAGVTAGMLGIPIVAGRRAGIQPKGAQNAEAIRSDTGQLPETGQIPEGGQEAGGHDVEQGPPEQPEPVESGGRAGAGEEGAVEPPTVADLEQEALGPKLPDVPPVGPTQQQQKDPDQPIFDPNEFGRLVAELKSVAAHDEAVLNAPVLPGPRQAEEVSDEEIQKAKAEPEAMRQAEIERVRASAEARGAQGTAGPARWTPPVAEPVEPVPAAEGGYRFADAVKDAGGLSAPPLDDALAEIRNGKSAARVVAEWSHGATGHDELAGILEEIAGARDNKEAVLYRNLRAAYKKAFAWNEPAGQGAPDETLAGLGDIQRAGMMPDHMPETEEELYRQQWEHHTAGPPVDAEATQGAQDAADFEVFNKSLTVHSPESTVPEIWSGDQKLGEVRTGASGAKHFVPGPEAERLPPEYQLAVMSKAGIDIEHGMAVPAGGEALPGLGTSQPELDPTMLRKLTKMASILVEQGKTSFPDFARTMSQALDGKLNQYYHAAYEQVRFYTEAWHLRDRLTPQEETETYDNNGNRTDRAGAAGGGPELSGTVGGAGRGRRPGLRVVDFRDLPAPRPIVRSGEYTGPGGAGLDEVQRFAVNAALTAFDDGKKAYLLGDGTGVGKTGTELAIANAYAQKTKLPSLIVTQSIPIIENRFKQDAVKLGVPMQNTTFITYSDLSTGKVPAGKFGVVIYDEAHNLKNAGSARETYSRDVQAERKVFATATPMDGPTHASYFLSELTGKTREQIASQLGFHYEQRMVNGKSRTMAVLDKDTSWGTVVDHIKKLRNLAVQAGQLIRREYPFYGRAQLREAPAYSKAQRDEQETIIAHWDKLINAARPGSNYRRNLAGQKTLELSRWAEIQKLPHIRDAMLQDYKDGKHVIVYAENYNPSMVKGLGKSIPGFLTELGKELDARKIPYAKVFEDDPYAKAKAAAAFQGGRVKVLLATPRSGGAGLDMDDQIGNAPRQAHAATLNFSADVFDQMLGRVSRRNTASPADFHVWMNRDSFADGRRMQVADRKLRVLRNIQAGEDLDTSEFEGEGEHGMPDFNGAFAFEPAESSAEQAARMVGEEVQSHQSAVRSQMQARAQERLTGSTGDLGQGDFVGGGDLFAPTTRASVERPMFIPLKSEFFEAFKSGDKREEYRKYGPGWNEKTAPVGRKVVLSKGYSGERLTGTITGFRKETNPQSLPGWNKVYGSEAGTAAVIEIAVDRNESEHGQPALQRGGVPGLPVEMDQTKAGKATIGQINAALEAVSRAAGGNTPIRSGRVTGRTAIGPNRAIYKDRQEVVRVRSVDDIPAATHEIAHDLAKQVFGRVAAGGDQGGSPAAMRELEDLGKALYGDVKPLAGYGGEGWAEYLRHWLSTDEAPTVAPHMTKWFNEQFLPLHPEIAEALTKARELITTSRLQGAAARAQAQLARSPGALRQIAQALGQFVSYKAQIESFAPLERLVKAAEARAGKLPPSENPFLLASWKRGSAGATVERMATEHMLDIWGNPVGPSLREAFAPVQGQRSETLLLAFAKAAQARWEQTRMVTDPRSGQRSFLPDPKNPGISLADAQHIIKTMSTPQREIAVQKWREWHNGLLDYLVQADPGMKPLADKWKSAQFYMPLARMIDPARAKAAAALANSNPFFRMRGSGLPVKDLLDQTMLNAARLVNRANRALVTNSIVKLSNLEGMGHLVEAIPRGRVRNLVSLDQVRAQLEDLGIDTSEMPKDRMLEYWTPADMPKGSAPIIAVGSPGQRRWFQVDPELYQTLDGLQTYSLKQALPGLPYAGKLLDLVLGAPTRMFRLGTTAIRPGFQFITQPARSLALMLMQGDNPARSALNYPAALAGVLKEGFGGKAEPYSAAFKDLGAHMGQPLGLDIGYTKRMSDELFHGRVIRTVQHPIDHLRQLLSIPEGAPRVAELKAIADKIGWTPGRPMLPDQAVQMALAAKRVTVDFSAAGDMSRVLNQAIPFYNITLQHTRAYARAFMEHPARSALLAGMVFAAPTLLNWWRNKDKEWYQAMPWKERYLYTWLDDGKNLWKIARPFEWGMTAMALPEAMADSWYRRDPEAVKHALGAIFTDLDPVDYPVLLKLAKEQWQNRIAYFDRPIVPPSEVGLPANQQRGPYTSRLAIGINKVFPDASPRRVDAFLRGYFGGAGTEAMQLIGLGPPRSGRGWEPTDLPVAGTLFRAGGQFNANNQFVADFYDRYNLMQSQFEAWQVQASRAKITGQPPTMQPPDWGMQMKRTIATGTTKEPGAAPALKALMALAGATRDNDQRSALYREAGETAKRAVEAFDRVDKVAAPNGAAGGK